jgi:hypothetical protein
VVGISVGLGRRHNSSVSFGIFGYLRYVCNFGFVCVLCNLG